MIEGVRVVSLDRKCKIFRYRSRWLTSSFWILRHPQDRLVKDLTACKGSFPADSAGQDAYSRHSEWNEESIFWGSFCDLSLALKMTSIDILSPLSTLRSKLSVVSCQLSQPKADPPLGSYLLVVSTHLIDVGSVNTVDLRGVFLQEAMSPAASTLPAFSPILCIRVLIMSADPSIGARISR